jgi:2-succinyl-5-enolpyruvyl-6-hydroxy-3-cyclohexene-1-carboxylate synthase
LNNDGGGVFHFLPISSHLEHFELLVAMPHGIDLSCLASAHGIPFHHTTSLDSFASVLGDCLIRPGPEVIEVRTDRVLNHKRHLETISAVSSAIHGMLGRE